MSRAELLVTLADMAVRNLKRWQATAQPDKEWRRFSAYYATENAGHVMRHAELQG